MADKAFTGKENVGLWIQPDGPGTVLLPLGCYGAEELEENLGGVDELIQCIGPDRQFKTLGRKVSAPEVIETTLGTYFPGQADALDKLRNTRLPFYLHVMFAEAGRADNVNAWKRRVIAGPSIITSRKVSDLIKVGEDTSPMHEFGLSVDPPLLDGFRWNAARVSVVETQALNDIAVNHDNRAASSTAAALVEGAEGAVAANAAAAATPNILFTANGASFTAGAADPLSTNENASAVARILIGATQQRIIVALGTTRAGGPCVVALSDDNGATWTSVTVGATNAQYALRGGALFALDQYNIWLCTTGGFIYKSEDGGATWTAQESGVATAQNLTQVKFVDKTYGWAAGANSAILKTANGGRNWSLVTGPAGQSAVTINSIVPVTPQRVFLGFNDGKLFVTQNGGTTWTQVTSVPWSGSGAITDIDFVNEMQGVLARNTAAPVGTLYVTHDGGYTWEAVQNMPSNSGINAVEFVSPLLAYAVGAVNSSTGFLMKAFV